MKRFQLSLWVCLVVCFGFSTYAQDTKEIIILQTSDVHSRIEPINQKGDRNYDEGGFVRRAKLYYLRDRVGKAAKVREKL